jgi:beta-mannosidase
MQKPFVMVPDVLDLAGEWSLISESGKHQAPYSIPGDIHSALIAANVIPHPYHGRNELEVRWVADEIWTAQRTFNATKFAGSSYYLDIDYLDTVAELRLNGQLVLKAHNCFLRYRPDVTEYLQEGENKIEIRFLSNTKAANDKQARQPFPIPYSTSNNPIPNGNMLRKPQCHFGWDWNLAIVPFGAYGRFELCRTENFRIENVLIQQQHTDDAVTVDVEVTLQGRGDTEIQVMFAGEIKTRRLDHAFGEARQRFRFRIDNPKLWWPTGQGEQTLYDVTVTCESQTVTRSIGLRKIELITSGEDGKSRFAFRVNGREIFCKGANWVPADALPSQATPDLTRKLLFAAKDANMNMIRVWGGGYYEKDYFYDICDELGLLVWQDFMFSCSLYPSTPDFLSEVKAEATYQVKRLQHHACLALWCGDNELIGALTWFKESKENRDRYLVNYDRLNRTIEDAMRTADNQGLWWPSSPSPGALDFGDAWHDDSKGDMHFWSVWHEGKNFEHYRDVQPLFCSEFGFQSFPSLRIAKQFITGDEDLNIASPVMEHHQRNAGGNARIAETMFRNFRFPMDFGNFVYLSQIQHALAMRTAIEYWRSLKPHCMGTLYWQLNDTWPVASWSGLDHGGGWKAVHHLAQRFFAPVLVCVIPQAEAGDFLVMGINDSGRILAIETDVFAISVAGKVTRLNRVKTLLPSDRSIEIMRIEKNDIPTDAILSWKWRSETKPDATADTAFHGQNHLSPLPYKTLALHNPGLKVSVETENKHVTIRITATRPALYVTIEAALAGTFSDNVLDILTGDTAEIFFTPDDPAALEIASKGIVVRDLYSASHVA